MPRYMEKERRKMDEEERQKFTEIHSEIGKIRRGEPTQDDKDYDIAQEKRTLDAMERQAEKTGTSKGLAEAFRKKRAATMKKEGFPGTTSEQIKAGKLYGGLPETVEKIVKKLGMKKIKKIRLKVR